MPFLTPLTEQTCCPRRVHRVYDEYSHSSTSTCEEFLQDIIIENLTIEEEESIHPTGRAMRISGSIQAEIVIAEPSLVLTNGSYLSKSTGRNESEFLADKIIVPKYLWGTPGMRQHDTQFSGATKVLSFMFGSEKYFVADSWTDEYGTANETKYAPIQETFVGNTLKCKKLNGRLCIYNMVYCLKIPILRDHNAI